MNWYGIINLKIVEMMASIRKKRTNIDYVKKKQVIKELQKRIKKIYYLIKSTIQLKIKKERKIWNKKMSNIFFFN